MSNDEQWIGADIVTMSFIKESISLHSAQPWRWKKEGDQLQRGQYISKSYGWLARAYPGLDT